MRKFRLLTFLSTGLVLSLGLLLSCKEENTMSEEAGTMTFEKPRVPDWHKNANIYEVNLRQYTPEGTFNAFAKELPRLKEMGVDILWFMPIHPISEKNRKGELGSPYAIADYKDVNPEFGSMQDFKNLLQAIHEAGMYAIIDWVPNHTGWDNPWITEHPDWYTKNEKGEITDPINYDTGEPWGWTDVADLDYSNEAMRSAMIDAMAFWVTEVGVDGFRVDVAHGVPVDFWEQATDSLYALEPLFMLAEAEKPVLLNNGSFIMDYGWEMHHLLNNIARSRGVGKNAMKLEKGNLVTSEESEAKAYYASDIDSLLAEKEEAYKQGYQMQFTSNHDENSWAGTVFDRFGEGHKTFAVLTATFNGMPLIYGGMEAAMDKQLEFFTKDTIAWGNYAYADFYKTLLDLKHRNQALWNGEHGGELKKIATGNDKMVYAFTREKAGDRVVVLLNLSAEPQQITLQGDNFEGTYQEVFQEKEIKLEQGQSMELAPWEYLVYSNR